MTRLNHPRTALLTLSILFGIGSITFFASAARAGSIDPNFRSWLDHNTRLR